MKDNIKFILMLLGLLISLPVVIAVFIGLIIKMSLFMPTLMDFMTYIIRLIVAL